MLVLFVGVHVVGVVGGFFDVVIRWCYYWKLFRSVDGIFFIVVVVCRIP